MSTSSSASDLNPVTAAILTEADRQAMAEVVVTIRASQHGCIYFAVCNNRLKIKAVEAALEQTLSPHGLGVDRVILAERDTSTEPPNYRVHITNPFDYFDGLPRLQPRLYLVHGLPELIREQTGGDSFKVASVSQLLNYRREYFHDKSICALFWLDPETLPYLIQKAPDFWSFRSGVAWFTDAPEMLRLPNTNGWQESAPSGRWSADLEEMRRQLAVYRRKTPPDENAIANLLLEIGRLHVQRHEFQDAFDTLHEAEEIFERLGLEERVSLVRTWLARAFRRTGQLEKAEESISYAMEIDREQHNEASLARDYNDLSQIYQDRGQLDEAGNYLREAIEIAERLGDEPSLSFGYSNLSQLYMARGHLDEADKWLRKAIAIAERLGNEPALATLYSNLSQIYDAQGKVGEAEKWLRMAIEIDKRLGDEPKLAVRYNNLSVIYKARGQLKEAEKWLRKAVEIDDRLGDESSLAIRYNNLSQIYQVQGQIEQAERWLRKSIEINERLRDQSRLAIGYNNLSQNYVAQGQLAEAERWLRKAIEIDEHLGREPNLAIEYSNQSQIYQARGQFEEAEKWLRKAIEIDERLRNEPNLAVDYNNLSEIFHGWGQIDEAEKWLRKAVALMEPKGPSANLEALKSHLAQLETQKKQQTPLS